MAKPIEFSDFIDADVNPDILQQLEAHVPKATPADDLESVGDEWVEFFGVPAL